MNLERSIGISVCYNFISFNKSHCIVTILSFVLLFLAFSFYCYYFLSFALDLYSDGQF